MNNKFLDKVCDQIISETRIIDDKVYTSPFSLSSIPFTPFLNSLHFYLPTSLYFFFFSSFSSHCKEIYSLNKEEIEYVWEKYKVELIHKVKKMMV